VVGLKLYILPMGCIGGQVRVMTVKNEDWKNTWSTLGMQRQGRPLPLFWGSSAVVFGGLGSSAVGLK